MRSALLPKHQVNSVSFGNIQQGDIMKNFMIATIAITAFTIVSANSVNAGDRYRHQNRSYAYGYGTRGLSIQFGGSTGNRGYYNRPYSNYGRYGQSYYQPTGYNNRYSNYNNSFYSRYSNQGYYNPGYCNSYQNSYWNR